MALVGSYLYDSFRTPLPWSVCEGTWLNCIDSQGNVISNNTNANRAAFRSMVKYFQKSENKTKLIPSSELYFS